MVHPASAILTPPRAKTFGFLVLPNFTTIGLASAVETLRMANLAAHRSLCLLYTSPSPRDLSTSRMPSSA